MKTAIFWGTPDNCYKESPVIVDSSATGRAMEAIITDYISGAEISIDHILGIWDPFFLVEDENAENLTIKDAYENCNNYSIILSFLYFTYYLPEKGEFIMPHPKKIVDTINVCTGWENEPPNPTQKVSFRIESGIVEGISKLPKKQQSKLIKSKLIKYIVKEYFKPGPFWTELQAKYKISRLIVPSPIHMVIAGDQFIISTDDLPRMPFKDEGAKKTVTYNIDSGLILGLKEIAKKAKMTTTDAFKAALLGS